MKPLEIAVAYNRVPEAPRTNTQGIWRDRRTALATLARTTRAALGARMVGEHLSIELDDDIIATHTHAAGWAIPILSRTGMSIILIDITFRAPDLLNPAEVVITAHTDWCMCDTIRWPADARRAAGQRLVSGIVAGLDGATSLARSLIRTLTQESDRQAVLTAGRIPGPPRGPSRKNGHETKGTPSQHGRSIDLFGAENRT